MRAGASSVSKVLRIERQHEVLPADQRVVEIDLEAHREAVIGQQGAAESPSADRDRLHDLDRAARRVLRDGSRRVRSGCRNGAALPSMIGTSGPSSSTTALSMPGPAKAAIRCSIVLIAHAFAVRQDGARARKSIVFFQCARISAAGDRSAGTRCRHRAAPAATSMSRVWPQCSPTPGQPTAVLNRPLRRSPHVPQHVNPYQIETASPRATYCRPGFVTNHSLLRIVACPPTMSARKSLLSRTRIKMQHRSIAAVRLLRAVAGTAI